MAREYDPVKAHAYYMAHRDLQGNSKSSPATSTKGLSTKGKEVAKFVKDQIKAEKKAEVEKAREAMKSKITAMRESFKNMSPDQKDAQREKLKSDIAGMREEWKGTSASIKTKYDEEYISELANLKTQYPKGASTGKKRKVKKKPWEK